MNCNGGIKKMILRLLRHLIVLQILAAPILARNHQVTNKDRS